MRTWAVALTVVAAAGTAHADGFGGFAGSEYVATPDRLCTPLAVSGGVAQGKPVCQALGAGGLAQRDVRPATAETGTAARFTARIAGKAVIVRGAAGGDVVSWTPIDAPVRLGSVFADRYGELVVVEVVVRRLGREVTDVVGFALSRATATPPVTPPPALDQPPQGTEPPALDAPMRKALAKARKAKGKKAVAAWTAVLALDPDASIAHAGLAAAYAQLGKVDDALAALDALARSPRRDAIEFLVAARFDKSFRKLLAEPRFRAVVGLDRGPTQLYERVMGLGGTWEQTGTPCDTPTVALALGRDRAFSLVVKTACRGERWNSKFKGTWRLDGGETVTLVMPNRGGPDEAVVCTLAAGAQEDALTCNIDEDLQFSALPVRR